MPSPVPALPDTERRTTYNPSASTGPFNVNFAIFGDGDDYENWIEVWLDGEELTPETDWTLDSPSGTLTVLARPITDARVTLTEATSGELMIVGARRPRRTTQLTEGVGESARSRNQTYSDMQAILREFWDRLGRTLQAPPGESFAPLPGDRENKWARFDEDGGLTAADSLNVGDLDDASVSGLSINHVLKWNGSAWVNAPENISGDIVEGDKGDITVSALGAWTIDPNAVITSKILDGAVTAPKLANSAVTARTLTGSAMGVRAGIVNGTLSCSIGGNALVISVKTLAGTNPSATDPVYFVFQDGAGGYVVRTVTAALSLTISSGSTLGAVSGAPFRVWVVAIDNGGPVVLGAVNCVSGTSILALVDHRTHSTSAEGGAGGADSAQVIYSAAGLATKYICIAGFATYETGLVAAGTWNALPSSTSLFAPGVPRPGDLVSTFNAETTNSTSRTQNTYQDTNLAVVCALRSAANLCRVEASGTILQSTGSVAAFSRIHRGATGIGTEAHAQNNTSTTVYPVTMTAVDKPNTASPTYTVKIKNSDNSMTVTFPYNSLTAAMTAQELMG